MSKETGEFELPKNIDRYFAMLSKLYARAGETQLQEIIVNAKMRIHEEWTYDGHAVYLSLPESLFLAVVMDKANIQTRILGDLNNVHNVRDECFDEVFLEMEVVEDQNWRDESGLLIKQKRIILPAAIKRIWSGDGCRVFLSHKNECKVQVAAIKDALDGYGLSCFVAHEDIHVNQEWQNEIESALFSMDVFVALMSDRFHDSDWTDQEIGVAIGLGVPIVSVRLGKDPYGFIGKYQAAKGDFAEPDWTASSIYEALRSNRSIAKSLKKSVFHCLENSVSFDASITLVRRLCHFESFTVSEIERIKKIHFENDQLYNSCFASGELRRHLTKVTGREFVKNGRELVEG